MIVCSWYTSGGQSSIINNLSIGDSSFLHTNNDLTVGVSLNNNGRLILAGNLTFQNIDSVGSLNFQGAQHQVLIGERIIITDWSINNPESVEILAKEVIVIELLNPIQGTIHTSDQNRLILKGVALEDRGYVDGPVYTITSNPDIVIPVGLDGFTNYLMLSDPSTLDTIRTKAVVPNIDSLLLDADIVGISESIEWQIASSEDTIFANISVAFNGVDLINFNNQQAINARAYEPAIALYSPLDTAFHALETSEIRNFNELDRSSGIISTREPVAILPTIQRITLAWIPVLVEPTFFIPNAFQPEGQLIENRIFRPFFEGEEIKELSIRVFDNFNNTVYSVLDTGESLVMEQYGWDGTVDGVLAEDGVYFYQIRLVTETANYDRTGGVLLVK